MQGNFSCSSAAYIGAIMAAGLQGQTIWSLGGNCMTWLQNLTAPRDMARVPTLPNAVT